MIEPLHIATIGGQPLRFFRTPLTDGRPDMPWLVIDDLGRCLGLSRADRRIHLRVFYRVREWKKIVRTVATPDGPVSIAPHPLAKLALEALIEMGRAPASALDEYLRASADALMQIAPGPFPTREAMTDWANAAANRWIPSESTISVADLFPKESGVTMGSEDEGESEYLLNEGQYWFLALAPTPEDGAKNANEIKHEVVKVLMAWRRGKLLLRWEVPLLAGMCDDWKNPDSKREGP